MELIFVGFVFVTFFVFVVLLWQMFGRSPGEDVRARMEQYMVETQQAAREYDVPADAVAHDDEEAPAPDEDDWVKEMRGQKGGGGVKKILANMGTIITPKGWAASISDQLAKADLPLKANEYMAIQFLAIMLPLIFGMLIMQSIPLGVLLAMVGAVAPKIWLVIMKARRVAAFNSQILDTLTMTANGLKAGYSFLQALEMVARESLPPMQTELKRVLRENSLGMPFDEALNALNQRCESEDWDLVTTVVLIQRQIGGNLAEILDKIAFTIRQRQKIKGDIQVKTSQAKISGLMVGVLPFGIGTMIYLINPAFITKLFTFKMNGLPVGLIVVAGGLLWEAIGIYVILKIVDIEV